MSTFQGEVTQASRGRIRDTSNSRKIHFGAGWLNILKVAARAESEHRQGLPAFFLFKNNLEKVHPRMAEL